jgi:hypothetical protein
MSVSTQNGHSNFERGGHFQRVIQLKRGDAIWHLSNVRFGWEADVAGQRLI